MYRSTVVMSLMVALVARAALAAVPIGDGDAGLLGGDLTDPADAVVDTGDYGGAKPEEQMKPPRAGWKRMRAAPLSPPGTAPHQVHPYQSWQNSPACAIFLNKPATRKWYVSFVDGGQGGPTDDDPYFCAVELDQPHVLTHFTLTTAGDMPDRDPKRWAIQGSNTGEEDDWTDLYVCDPADRAASPLAVDGRLRTTLFTSFTSADVGDRVAAADLRKLTPRLAGVTIDKPDFPATTAAYSWFRIVVWSCFNPNSTTFVDFNRPPGFSLAQVELFGVPGKAAAPVARAGGRRPRLPADQLIRPEAFQPAFIISYWCGPPRSETTVERYREIRDCGFNVAFPAIDQLWSPPSPESDAHNQRYLEACREAGLAALVWDGGIPKGDGWPRPTAAEIPGIHRALDGLIAKYAGQPAFLGYVLADEMGVAQHPRLAVVTKYLRERDPRHLPYYNLLPNYAFKTNAEYEAMVKDYVDTVDPALFSWDHYRQMFGDGDETFYWHNLEIVRRACLARRVPYNQIIVCLKHMGYRECSAADLRWQVYTSLAYGSRGIQYFTYWYVKELAWAEAPALITKDGGRDVKWDHVRTINTRIAMLGPTLARLTSTGAFCTAPVPPGGRRLRGGGPVRQAEGGPLVIGGFQDPEGREYVMVVNRSLGAAVTARLTFDPRISAAAEISQETGLPLAAVPTRQGPLAVPLEPGEGRLFALTESGLFHQPPRAVAGGHDLRLDDITYEPSRAGAEAAGAVFWRSRGATDFTRVPLGRTDGPRYAATLPAAATSGPFEYYLEMQEPGGEPTRDPPEGPGGPRSMVPDLAPPAAVSGLRTTTAKSWRVAVAWDEAGDDVGIAEYRVFRGAAADLPAEGQEPLATLAATERTFTDAAPPVGQPAWYAVQPVDLVGRVGEARSLRVDVPGHEPPAHSLAVRATAGSKCVVLSWSGAVEPIVTVLEIYKGRGPDGPLEKVAEVADLATPRWVDRDVAAGATYRYDVRPRSKAGLVAAAGNPVAATPLVYLRRINCGGPAVTSADGVDWEADAKPAHELLAVGGSAIDQGAAAVAAAGELAEICRTERWAHRQLGYTFPVPPGRYELVLVFAETNPSFFGAGKRTFDIVVNGDRLVEKADVFTAAGGPLTPWEFRRAIDVADGELAVRLDANRVGPALKGIEVRGIAGPAAALPP